MFIGRRKDWHYEANRMFQRLEGLYLLIFLCIANPFVEITRLKPSGDRQPPYGFLSTDMPPHPPPLVNRGMLITVALFFSLHIIIASYLWRRRIISLPPFPHPILFLIFLASLPHRRTLASGTPTTIIDKCSHLLLRIPSVLKIISRHNSQVSP